MNRTDVLELFTRSTGRRRPPAARRRRVGLGARSRHPAGLDPSPPPRRVHARRCHAPVRGPRRSGCSCSPGDTALRQRPDGRRAPRAARHADRADLAATSTSMAIRRSGKGGVIRMEHWLGEDRSRAGDRRRAAVELDFVAMIEQIGSAHIRAPAAPHAAVRRDDPPRSRLARRPAGDREGDGRSAAIGTRDPGPVRAAGRRPRRRFSGDVGPLSGQELAQNRISTGVTCSAAALAW